MLERHFLQSDSWCCVLLSWALSRFMLSSCTLKCFRFWDLHDLAIHVCLYVLLGMSFCLFGGLVPVSHLFWLWIFALLSRSWPSVAIVANVRGLLIMHSKYHFCSSGLMYKLTGMWYFLKYFKHFQRIVLLDIQLLCVGACHWWTMNVNIMSSI